MFRICGPCSSSKASDRADSRPHVLIIGQLPKVVSAPTRNPCALEETPRRSAISLILISRLGVTTHLSSAPANRYGRREPPVSPSCSQQAMACPGMGLTYSKGRIITSLLFHRGENMIRRYWKKRHSHASGIGNSVGDRSAGQITGGSPNRSRRVRHILCRSSCAHQSGISLKPARR